MDLSPDLTNVALLNRAGVWLFDSRPDLQAYAFEDPDVQSLARIFIAIRDAATAAERQRCIAYLEHAAAEALTVNLGNVLRCHANALRSGDHE